MMHFATTVVATLCSLCNNSIGDEGAAALAEALQTNTSLTGLDLSQNPLTTFSAPRAPPTLCNLVIIDCNLLRLPPFLADVSADFQLDCRYNPLVFPPESVCRLDIDAIRSYMRQTRQGQLQLQRSRLLLLGDGGAGKTTLKAALQLCSASPAATKSHLASILKQTRAGVAQWSCAEVSQWIAEISNNDAICKPRFTSLDGRALLSQTQASLQLLAPHRPDVARHIARVVQCLNTVPDTPEPSHDLDAATVEGIRFATPNTLAAALEKAGVCLSAATAQHLEVAEIDGASLVLLDEHRLTALGVPPGPALQLAALIGQLRQQHAQERQQPTPFSLLLDLPHVWTEGVDLTQWEEAGVTVWDFAGQIEYFPGHHLFLSSVRARAVTTVVFDARQPIAKSHKRLQHWLSTLGASSTTPDQCFGDGAHQLEAVKVLVVATHTDTHAFRELVRQHGPDHLDNLVASLRDQFAPSIAIHERVFCPDYTAEDGGDLPLLQTAILEACSTDVRHHEMPACLQPVLECVQAIATAHAAWPVVDANFLLAHDECAEAVQTLGKATVLVALEEKGFVKAMGKASPDNPTKLVLKPMLWLSKLVALLFHPLKGLRRQSAEATPLSDIVALLQTQGFESIEADELKALLEQFQLCVFLPRSLMSTDALQSPTEPAGDQWVACFPTLLPPLTSAKVTLAAGTKAWVGRRFFTAREQESVPPSFLTLVLGHLVKVLTGPPVLRCGAVVGKAGDCHVLVTLCGDEIPNAVSGFDVLVSGGDPTAVQQTLAAVSFLTVSVWSRHFTIPLLKHALCSVVLCPQAQLVDETSVVGPLAWLALNTESYKWDNGKLQQIIASKPRHLQPAYTTTPYYYKFWHLLCDPQFAIERPRDATPTTPTDVFLLCSPTTTITPDTVARFQKPEPSRIASLFPIATSPARPSPTTLRVLILRNNFDIASNHLELDREEFVVMHEALTKAALPTSSVTFESIGFVTRDRLREHLARFKPHCIHVCGHGGSQGIELVAPTGDAVDLLNSQGMAQLLSEAGIERLPLLILNSCNSGGMAANLSQLGCVSHTVGVEGKAINAQSLEFAYGFWVTLFKSGSFPKCYREGVRLARRRLNEHAFNTKFQAFAAN